MINDFHDTWTMLESSYGSQQSGIQAVINAELALVKWDGQTPTTTHRDHMKEYTLVSLVLDSPFRPSKSIITSSTRCLPIST
jgi:hypothetical protein